jgi:hypothetical protein
MDNSSNVDQLSRQPSVTPFLFPSRITESPYQTAHSRHPPIEICLFVSAMVSGEAQEGQVRAGGRVGKGRGDGGGVTGSSLMAPILSWQEKGGDERGGEGIRNGNSAEGQARRQCRRMMMRGGLMQRVNAVSPSPWFAHVRGSVVSFRVATPHWSWVDCAHRLQIEMFKDGSVEVPDESRLHFK